MFHAVDPVLVMKTRGLTGPGSFEDTGERSAPRPGQRRARRVLRVATVLTFILLLPAVADGVLGTTPFGAHGDANGTGYAMAVAMIALPFNFVGSCFASWVFYSRSRYRLAMTTTLLPLVNVALIVALGAMGGTIYRYEVFPYDASW